MKQDFSYKRRSFIIRTLNFFMFAAIAARLFFLQIIKGDKFKTLSLRNSIKLMFLEPKRGFIYDANNKKIAINSVNYKLIFYKIRGQDFNKTLNKTFKFIKLDNITKNKILNRVKTARLITPIVIQESLTWSEVAVIESHSHELPGVFIEKGYKRTYPYKDLFCHVGGYMGQANKEEIKQYNLYHNQNFKVGKAGIEKTKQTQLIGQFGMKKVEVNASRKIVREFSEIKSIPGSSVKIALDHRIQNFVKHKLGNKGATAVVMNVHTGQIISMVSTPTFDPNLFSTGMSHDQWNHIINNPSFPLTNKSIGKLYPPGSIWKIIVAIAILESGIKASETVNCKGYTIIGNKKFKCWKHSGHGNVDLYKALMTSCNPYFYQMSQQVGISKINSVAQKFGFGEKTGIDLPGELSGINPEKSWKKDTYGLDWLIGDTANASIGQGFILSTPLQMATMMARLASGLNVIPSVMYNHNSIFNRLDINPEFLRVVRDGLTLTVNDPKGTGYRNRIRNPKYKMAAKTGTAQVISRDTSFVGDKERHLKSHAIFTGFAPVHSPKFSTSVIIDHGGWGSSAASPVGKEILEFVQKTLS